MFVKRANVLELKLERSCSGGKGVIRHTSHLVHREHNRSETQFSGTQSEEAMHITILDSGWCFTRFNLRSARVAESIFPFIAFLRVGRTRSPGQKRRENSTIYFSFYYSFYMRRKIAQRSERWRSLFTYPRGFVQDTKWITGGGTFTHEPQCNYTRTLTINHGSPQSITSLPGTS